MTSTPAGRPRDPGVDRRVTDAAVSLYGEVGWAGFSMEGVARRARVGKASIYLRWTAKEQLLADALAGRLGRVSDADTGTARGDLTELARQLLQMYGGDVGRAALRIGLEAPNVPQLSQRYEALRESQVLAARAIVRRGIQRGELPAGTSVTLLLDTLCGGAMMHALSTPARYRPRMAAHSGGYAERLVNFLLSAVLTDR
jgi:AcrR family transcriptional regulator